MSTEPQRTAVAPECPHVSRCGGCTRLLEPMQAQLEAKRARLTGALSPHRELVGIVAPTVAAAHPAFGYRPRAKWVVGPAGEVGLFARDADHEANNDWK